MSTIHGDLDRILKGLEEQGVSVRKAKQGYRLYFPDGESTTIASTTDRRTMQNQRAVIRRHGLRWPLDPEPKTPRKTRVPKSEPTPTARRVETETTMAAPKSSAAPAELIEVTPAIAEEWLEKNTRNRKLSDITVSKYATFMREGQWHYDASPIRFAEHGAILDGQHRLWAIVESGTTQTFLVVRGLPDRSFATIDTGKSRSFGDILSIQYPGIAAVNHVAAITALLYRWEKGYRNRMLRPAGNGPSGVVAPETMLDFFASRSEQLVTITREAHTYSQRIKGISTSILGLMLWITRELDVEDSEYFMERLSDGVGLEQGSPILALRNYLRASADSSQDKRTSLPNELGVAVCIKAWNAFRRGDPIIRMQFRTGGARPEPFPEPE